MKDLEMTPKNQSIVYFLIVALLIYQHTFLLKSDMAAWILCNFYISGMLAVYCLVKGIKAWKRRAA